MPRGARAALVALVAVGAALRLWQYLANASLWIDEIAVAQNVLYWPLAHLLKEPLALDQVASPLFLAAVKGVAWVWGPSEKALRLVPLVSGLLALVLFPRLTRRFQPPWIAVFATGLFALAPTLIAHGAELKPYSTDLLAAVALTLAAFGLDARASAARFAGAAVLGAAAVWFSQGAVFVVAGLAAALFALARRERAVSGRLVALVAAWAVSAGLAVASGLHRVPPEMRAYLDRFWTPSLPKVPLLVFVAVAAWLLWKRSPRAALLLVGPVVVTLGAAAAKLYPFSGRAILFLAPAAILALAEAAGWIVEGLARVHVPRKVAAAIPALALVGLIAHDPPVYRDEDARPVLAALAARWRPGDALYVYYGGGRSFRYYGPLVHLSSDGAVLGGCHRSEPREYLHELDRFRGRPRVWVFRTHVSYGLGEGPLVDGYLARLGKKVDRIEADDADATLWDLSGGAGAPADLSDTQPLPPGDPALAARFGCGHGPIGTAPWD
ncbi:MAG TPA: hypothetical protein VMN82_03060 [Thermoanaerobaculia bacterium]|nr:hypothetical protein [Thermoanaerobaculia bacterium]